MDGLGEQMADAQLKLDAVRALQNRLVPLVAELNAVKTDITTAHGRIDGVKFDEATVAEQERRFVELVAASKGAVTEVNERTRQMQLLSEELARSAAIKDELLGELDRVQSRQRDTVGQVQASEDQLGRAERMFKQLEQRSRRWRWRKLGAVESRLLEIRQVADDMEKSIQAIASREQLVNTVKSEVEQVYQISARSKGGSALRHREPVEIAALKTRVTSRCRDRRKPTSGLSRSTRRKMVDEVQVKANAIVHLLDDVRINPRDAGRAEGGRRSRGEGRAARVHARTRGTRCGRSSTSASWPSASRRDQAAACKDSRCAGRKEVASLGL